MARARNRTSSQAIKNDWSTSLIQTVLLTLIVLALHDLLDQTPQTPKSQQSDSDNLAHYIEQDPLNRNGLFTSSSGNNHDNNNATRKWEVVSWQRAFFALKQQLRSSLPISWPGIKSIVVQVEAIRLLRLEAPVGPVQAGQPIKLRCMYETTRGDKLQSLSWYKNGREFYRYQPFERRQPVLAFNLTGVDVDMIKSKNSTVILVNTTSDTSGRYKCEATGTSFQEVNMETFVNVIKASSGAHCLSSNSTISHYILIAISIVSWLIYSDYFRHRNKI